MQISLLHVALTWLAVLVVLLLVAARAKRRWVWTAANVAAITISVVPAVVIAWMLVTYLTSERGLLYAEGPPKPSDFSLLEWAIFSVPGLATVLGVGILIRRWGSIAPARDD